MRNAIISLLLAATLWPVAAQADERKKGPGFDCGRATRSDELAICADDDLRGMDLELSQQYGELVARASSGDRSRIRKVQRSWLARRADVCRKYPLEPPARQHDRYCLYLTYSAQARVLSYLAGDLPPARRFGLPPELVTDQELLSYIPMLKSQVPGHNEVYRALSDLPERYEILGLIGLDRRIEVYAEHPEFLLAFVTTHGVAPYPSEFKQAALCNPRAVRVLLEKGWTRLVQARLMSTRCRYTQRHAATRSNRWNCCWRPVSMSRPCPLPDSSTPSES